MPPTTEFANAADNAADGFSLAPDLPPGMVPFGSAELELIASLPTGEAADACRRRLALQDVQMSAEVRQAAASSLAARGLITEIHGGEFVPAHAALATTYLMEHATHLLGFSLLRGEAEVGSALVITGDAGTLVLEAAPIGSFRVGVIDADMPIQDFIWDLLEEHLTLAEDAIVSIDASEAVADAATRALAVRQVTGPSIAAAGTNALRAESDGGQQYEIADGAGAITGPLSADELDEHLEQWLGFSAE